MKSFKYILLLICLQFSWYFVFAQKATVDYIDPFIGTGGLGHTTPSATTPFGMVQLGPSMDIQPWNWKRCSGYHYDDSCIMGFAHNHISGAGLCALGDILMMPMSGVLKTVPGTIDCPDSGYMSRFNHDKEKASAGYYSVYLSDYNINVELTATSRVGFHRYTVENKDSMHVIFDPIHGIGESQYLGEVEFLSSTEIRGFKESNGQGGLRRTYFYAKSSRPFDCYGIVTEGMVYPFKKNVCSSSAKAYVSFNTTKTNTVEFKVALSYTGYEGAKANYIAEAKSLTFDDALSRAKKTWQDKCDLFSIEGSEREKRIFYTSVYHSFFSPNLISDVTGEYFVNGRKRKSDIVQYSNFSTWDTYRATHPLFTLVDQQKVRDFVNSLASRRVEAGVGLPLWECVGYDNCCMIGRSPVAVMAEAILKDIPGIDVENAYLSMYESLFATDKCSPHYGNNNGMKSYLSRYYITSDVGCSVSKTVEYNYYDYTMSRVAQKLGKKEDAIYFHKRSLGYRHLWNSKQGFLWPKDGDGDWLNLRMENWEDLIKNYVSGNIWGYSSYTPHDMDYMINIMGGKKKYEQWLDHIFNNNTPIGGTQHVDISGFIGKYGHGDEPSHQMPYLYSIVEAPEKTQQLVHYICKQMYNDSPDGLINNDDLGQMSSWYIFSVLGFYPVNPASCKYVLGTPLYREAVLKLDRGKKLKITTENWNDHKYLIDKVFFNGRKVEGCYLDHFDLMQGGELKFVFK